MITEFNHRHDETVADPAPAEAGAARIAALEAEVSALRDEVEQSRRVLGSATEYAIIALDPEGRISSWNSGARHVLGYAEAEILGHSGEIFFTQEDRADGAFVAELCRALDNGRATNERWHLRKDGSRFWASGAMMPLVDDEGRPHGFLNILRDGTERQAEAERRTLIQAELAHRVKNTLALAHAVAVQTSRYADTPEAFQAAFGSRLRALARSQDMLAQGGWDGAPLREVIERALEPYEGPPGRISTNGLPLRLASAAVVKLSLAFHELATNAAKYGSLSVPEGGVEVIWSMHRPPSGKRVLEIVWHEHGGPPVTPPKRQGFGSRLLEKSLRHEFGCTVTLNFAPTGLECRICLPLTSNVLGV